MSGLPLRADVTTVQAHFGSGPKAAVSNRRSVATDTSRSGPCACARPPALCPARHRRRERGLRALPSARTPRLPRGASGFCFLNNSAIAAAHLRLRHERVAILDVDVHDGNGTQGIFYSAPTCTGSRSMPIQPLQPVRLGYAHERGVGNGLGANLNISLPIGKNDDGACTTA
jgi:Histone deacetylase domain